MIHVHVEVVRNISSVMEKTSSINVLRDFVQEKIGAFIPLDTNSKTENVDI